jgi:hypothetical protein
MQSAGEAGTEPLPAPTVLPGHFLGRKGNSDFVDIVASKISMTGGETQRAHAHCQLLADIHLERIGNANRRKRNDVKDAIWAPVTFLCISPF